MSRPVKSLLIKDFKLMKSQMKFFIVIMLVWGVIMASNISSMFLVGYTALFCSVLTWTTFSYDESENSMAYLFTLSVMRKDYIYGKYIFGFLISTLPTIMVSIIVRIVQIVQGKENHLAEYLLGVAISLLMAYLLLALEIPLVVRFGQEKSRIISVLIVGAMSTGFGIISYLSERIGIDSVEAANNLVGLGTGLLILLALAALIILMLISYKISCRFIEKKEF